MKRKNIILLTFFMCSIFIMAQDAYMYTEKDSTKMSHHLDDVEIVAFKSNKNLSQQPVSASTLTKEAIKDLNINTMKDISALVPNFFMPDYGSKYTSPVFVRGVGSRINSPSVGLYVDGIPYFDRSSFDFNINDIDRIEVLRGSQGTIYGRNTMGGIINVYTKSPFQYQGTNLGVSGGNYNNYRVDGSHTGNVNNVFGYSVSANYLHNGGYFTNRYIDKKADNMDAFAGRIRLGWQINSQLTAYLTSAYEYSDQDGYPYSIYDAETNTAGAVNYNIPSYYRRNMSNNGLTIDYKTSDFQIGSQTSFQYLNGKQSTDQDFTPEDKYYVFFSHQHQMYSQEINIKSVKDSPYKWLFGAFGFYQNYSQQNDVEYRLLNKESIVDVSNPLMGYALYHQSTLDNIFTKGLSLTLGVRYDWERTKMENNTTTITTSAVNSPPIKGKDIFSRFTPKASLQYSFKEDNITYFSATNGYKAGGFNTTVEEEKDRTFKPEYNWTYELGWKSSFFDRLIQTEVSVFYMDWKDQQVTQKRATEEGFKLRNAGKSVSKGFEFSAQIAPTPNLNFQLNYGYTYAKFKEYVYDEAKGIDYSGNFLPLVPRNTFSAAGNYTLNVKSDYLDKIKFNLSYVGLGTLYWLEDNKTSQPYYSTLNGQISFQRRNISIDVWSKNMTNEKYIAYYFQSMGNTFAQQSRPFTIGMDINMKF